LTCILKERQLRKGRIVFERTKTNTGTRIDLKLHPKAIGVIDRNKVTGSEWLFRGKIKSSTKCLGVLTSALIFIRENYSLKCSLMVPYCCKSGSSYFARAV
jgi:hypothetical protein